jgi:cell division protein FtsN
MAGRRKKSGNRRGTRKKTSGGIPAWFWLLGGILIGLGLAVALMLKGYLPELKQHLPSVDSTPPGSSESALVEDESTKTPKPKKPRYDFFTVLPEMEVVVPEQELSRQADKAEPAPATTANNNQDRYILQVGSFRSAADAEQMKARLALLGSMATVQTVTVNDQTWHRVRIGPFEGARKADEMRRMLSDNKIDTLVMKANP